MRAAGYPNTLNGGGYSNENERLYLEGKCDTAPYRPTLSRGAQAAIVLVMMAFSLGGAAYYVAAWEDQSDVHTEIIVNRKASLAFSSSTAETNMDFENPLATNA